MEKQWKRALTIAGSDCSGGAGIQADLKTFSAHGVFGMSAIVSVFAENTSRVLGVYDVSPEMIAMQIDAVYEDIGTDAVKVGMLSGPACMEAVCDRLRHHRPQNVVIDPVMIAKGGHPLMAPDAVGYLISHVLPLADVLTPNIPEAECITGMEIKTQTDMEEAARRIAAMGPRYVLVKGGHAQGDAADVLFDGTQFQTFTTARIDTKNTHGTGCTFSSAIASQLALGRAVEDAVARAKAYVTTAIRHAIPLGHGHGPTHHFYDVYQHGLTDTLQN